jgi:serine-type D-Ala-D-Ala carboxypeptidase/endopeptidase
MGPILYLFIPGLILLSPNAYTQEKSNSSPVSEAIEKNGKAFLKNKDITSVSIGVFKAGEIYTQHFGEIEKGKGNVPNDETIYEIASVTKTATGYLVAKAVLEKKIKLEEDVRVYLKGTYPNLEYNQKPITIKHLLTHTSGLPGFLPKEMNGVFEKLNESVPNDYYALEKSYGREQFLSDLKNLALAVEPGTKYTYSNVGAELLGYVLETVYGKTIDELLQESFLKKYAMLNTAIELSEAQKQKLVRGYWMSNTSASPNQLNTLWATAGGLKMNMTDVLHYMDLQLNSEDLIVAESHKVLYEEGNLLKIAYFWRVWNDKYGTSYNHHGGTSGTQNWLFIYPKYKLGISIITNQSGPDTPNLLNKTAKKILESIIKE